MKKYLFFVSHAYSYSILRPIQEQVWKRGGETAWFIEEGCPIYLEANEKQLKTAKELIDYNPIATFAPSYNVYDFIPGIKVQVFHGFAINKRPGVGEHYFLKGWFDLYCTQGEDDTREFQRLAEEHKYFKVVQTGWSKMDSFFDEKGELPQPHNEKPTIMYSSTFTKWITSAPHLYEEIERLIQKRDWQWLLTLHPKMDKEVVDKYKQLAKYDNVQFYEGDNNVKLLQTADVMICDSSSIIVEFLYFQKPVVTFKNTVGGNHLIDIDDPQLLESSIDEALSRPAKLMQNISTYIQNMHPFADGKSSIRILDAVDAFIVNDKGKLKTKPLNWFRKLKVRKKMNYISWRGITSIFE